VDFPDDYSVVVLQLNITRRPCSGYERIFAKYRSGPGLFGSLRQLVFKRALPVNRHSFFPIVQLTHETRRQCANCKEQYKTGKDKQS
jgi:hypothetical protein